MTSSLHLAHRLYLEHRRDGGLVADVHQLAQGAACVWGRGERVSSVEKTVIPRRRRRRNDDLSLYLSLSRPFTHHPGG